MDAMANVQSLILKLCCPGSDVSECMYVLRLKFRLLDCFYYLLLDWAFTAETLAGPT